MAKTVQLQIMDDFYLGTVWRASWEKHKDQPNRRQVDGGIYAVPEEQYEKWEAATKAFIEAQEEAEQFMKQRHCQMYHTECGCAK